MRPPQLLVLLGLALLAGCGAGLDAGLPPSDAGGAVPDAGVPDAGVPDAGRAGPGLPDAGPADGGAAVLAAAGTYRTHYQLEVSAFASASPELATLLEVLQALLEGRATACPGLEAQLLCLALARSVAQAPPPPPWVGELLAVLTDLFRLGATPLRAAGELTLVEHGDRLAATEAWTSLWVEHGGRTLDLLAGPEPLAVVAPPFEGTRTATELTLGPRRVAFDAERLLVRLLGVAISAGSGGRAHDVAGLLDQVLCRPLLDQGSADALACVLVARTLADRLESRSRPGGLAIRAQTARLGGAVVAETLGTAAAPGSLQGELSNGLQAWPLAPAPRTAWQGLRRAP